MGIKELIKISKEQGFTVLDPEDVFLSLFEATNNDSVLSGTNTQFWTRTLLIMIVLIALRGLIEW